MLDAIKNLLNLLKTELYDPFYNAFIDNELINNVLNVINKILNAIFKLWNNENVIQLTISDISTALTFIVLILLLYVVFVSIDCINSLHSCSFINYCITNLTIFANYRKW